MLTANISWLAAVAAALSQASPVAVPEDQPALENRQVETGNLTNYFPDCKTDPSYTAGPSQYTDGEGIRISTSCTTGHDSDHCWTDYFIVNYQNVYAEWAKSGQVIDCKTTDTCNEINVNMNQSCTTDTTTWDNTFGTSIQVQLPLLFHDKASATGGLSYDHSFGGSKDVQICTSVSSSGYSNTTLSEMVKGKDGLTLNRTCSWKDQDCHAIWTAQRNIEINGYLRRSCVAPRSSKGNAQIKNAPQRPDGFYTAGMMDVSFQIPNNRIVGCAADCSDLTYPNPTPSNDPITPFVALT